MSRDRTTWAVTRRVGELTTSLSFAVELVDAYTGGRPSGSQTVALADQSVTAVENPSGYHLFLDLGADPVDVVVDGGDRYFDERVTVSHSGAAPDGSSAVEVTDRSTPVEIDLTPTPAFQFSPGTTTIRGTVVDEADSAVPDAAVSLDGFAPTARTTAAGEFALLVPVTASDVVRDGDEKRVTDPTGGPTDGASGDDAGNGSPATGSGSGPLPGRGTGHRATGLPGTARRTTGHHPPTSHCRTRDSWCVARTGRQPTRNCPSWPDGAPPCGSRSTGSVSRSTASASTDESGSGDLSPVCASVL